MCCSHVQLLRTYIDVGTSGATYWLRASDAVGLASSGPGQGDRVALTERDFAKSLNAQIERRAYSVQTLAVLTLAAGITLFLGDRLPVGIRPWTAIVAASLFTAGVILALRVRQAFAAARTSPLVYNLDDIAAGKYRALTEAVQGLSKSDSVWSASLSGVDRGPLNPPEAPLVGRAPVRAGPIQPPFLSTSINTVGLTVESTYTPIKLCFLPDQLLVFRDSQYGLVPYGGLNAKLSPKVFLEPHGVPVEASVGSSLALHAEGRRPGPKVQAQFEPPGC